MSERDGFEPGVPCWVDTAQPDPEAAMGFYAALFGWEFEGPGAMPGDPPGEYHMARLRSRDVAGVSSLPAGAGSAAVWNTYVWVESAGEASEQVKRAGGNVLVEPFDVLPAGRMAVVADPAGAMFCVWEPKAMFCVWEPKDRRGAQVVNEPGAWAMSALNTRDPEESEAFYGAVFGWTTEEFDLGEAKVKLWRLPGFAGGEPEQPVARDVVATMAVMTSDQFPADVPPHWSVDFWVDDVDATADVAASRGGEVIAGPFDIPVAGLRSAVLADPKGATFSVTKVGAAG